VETGDMHVGQGVCVARSLDAYASREQPPEGRGRVKEKGGQEERGRPKQ